jgi:hypothetical protein
VLPASLAEVVEEELARANVPVSRAHRVEGHAKLVAFVVEGDYILAEDFEVEVPEFRHQPEWFRP